MQYIGAYISEKLHLGKQSHAFDYEAYGKGEIVSLDIEDYIKNTFYLSATDHHITKFYDTLKQYEIDPNAEFYHIKDKDTEPKSKVMKTIWNCPKADHTSFNIYLLTVSFYNTDNIFIISFSYHNPLNHKLVNEFFLYHE